MIPALYEPFRHWSDGGSVFILSDLHFDDEDCKLMDSNWISTEKQIAIINNNVENYKEGCKHINLASNICEFTPVNLGKLIKDGILSDIEGIHRKTRKRRRNWIRDGDHIELIILAGGNRNFLR